MNWRHYTGEADMGSKKICLMRDIYLNFLQSQTGQVMVTRETKGTAYKADKRLHPG